MKFLVAITFWLLLFLSRAEGAAVYVQSDGITGSGSFQEVTLTGVVGGNSFLVAAWSYNSLLNAPGNFSDDQSNTYGTDYVPDTYVAISYASNVAAGTTVVTCTAAASTFMGCVALEASGVHSTPSDGENFNQAAVANPDSNSITTTTAGILLGVLNYPDSAQTFTEAAGWNVVFEDESFACCPGAVVYRIGAVGTYNAEWTAVAPPGLSLWSAAIKGFKEAAAAMTTVRRRILQ